MPNLEDDLLYKLLIAGKATTEDQRYAAEWIARLYKVEAAARNLMDNSPTGDDDKPYISEVAGREFDALYLSLPPVT